MPVLSVFDVIDVFEFFPQNLMPVFSVFDVFDVFEFSQKSYARV